MKKFFYLMALAVFSLASCSDDDEGTATISGCISENVVGLQGGVTYLAGIEVTLKGDGVKTQTVETDGKGQYSFRNLNRGSYHLSFEHDSYVDVDTTVNLFNLTSYTIDLTMKYDLEGGSGVWTSNDNMLTLALQNNMFTLKKKNVAGTLFEGFYEANESATRLTFTDREDETIRFEADYLG